MSAMRRIALLSLGLAAGLAASAFAYAHGPSGAGELASAAAATKTVEVEMFDADGHMGFKPDRVEVARGAVVKFVIHNGGSTTHEFVLGDAAENAAHARMKRQAGRREQAQ